MSELAIAFFAIATLVPWFVERSSQVFHPMKLWSALQVVMVVPAAFLVLSHPHYVHPDVLSALKNGVPAALSSALFVYGLCNASVYLSYYAINGRRYTTAKFFQARPKLGRADTLFSISVLLSLGVFAFSIKLSTVGGAAYLFDNVSQRVELQRGLGPLNFLIDTSFWIALLISIRRLALRKTTADLLLCLSIFAIAAVSSTLFGGRKFTLQLIVGALMFFSLYRPEFMKFGLRTLLFLAGAYLLMMVYFFAILFYRNTNDIGAVVESFPMLVDSTLLAFNELLMSISYLDNYIFIVSHFDSSNYFGGATFNDLYTAFIPSSLLPDKPPVDEGLYVRYASLGIYAEPGTPANLMREYGAWPSETVGTAYMNGGTVLVVFCGLVLGTILAFGIQLAAKHPDSSVALFMLGNLVLNFEISNLRIVSLVTGTLFAAAIISFTTIILLLVFGRPARPYGKVP